MIDFRNADQTQIRWDKHRLRLGDPNPQCATCELKDHRALCTVRRRKHVRVLCMNDKLRERGFSERSHVNKLADFKKAGYDDPSCFFCQERDLRTLQLHHMAGHANSGVLIPACGNCHAIASDAQVDLPLRLLSEDPDRRPLLIQAAFDFGLAIVTGTLGVGSADRTQGAFWGIITLALIAWGFWNIAADAHFASTFGTQYSEGILAEVPG